MSPIGIKVVLKFHNSKDPNGNIRLVSRTLGKLSLVNNDFSGVVNDQEVWICQIEKEIHPNRNKGVFIVRPIKKVDVSKLKKLIPGFYRHVAHDRTIFLYPKSLQNEPWLISIETRSAFSSKYISIIVPIDCEEEGE